MRYLGGRSAAQSAWGTLPVVSILQKLRNKSWRDWVRAARERTEGQLQPLRERLAFQGRSGDFRAGGGGKAGAAERAVLRRLSQRPGPPAFLFDADSLPRLLEELTLSHPGEVDAILARAERLLAGDFSEFCPLAREPQLPLPRWHHDLTTGAEWPLRWARSIDYSSEARPGEIRHLWDLHRQLFLPALAQAWRLSRDPRFLARLDELYHDWWRANPLGRGIGWIGPQIQEHALRNVQWIACLFLLLDDEQVPQALRADLLRGIRLQSEVLDWHYKDDKPLSHNHLVSESLGLWLPGLLFPELPGAARWRRRGGEGLRRALELQFGEDGLQKEWTTNYHCFVLESALLARCLCAANQDPLLDGLDERLARAAVFAVRAGQPDGRIPYLGDADDALVYLWSASPHTDRRRYAASLALLLERPDLAAEAGALPAESLWLCGPGAGERWRRLAEAAPALEPLSFHPGLNTLILRDEEAGDWLLLQGGPSHIEPRVGGSHLHADRNSLLCWQGGKEVLLDPGTWLYNGSDESRRLLRATRSHSTASLEGRDQCDLGRGRFVVAELPRTEPLLWSARPLLALGRTESRAGKHTRQLARPGRSLYLLDQLEGEGLWAEAGFITPPAEVRASWRLWRLEPDGSWHEVEEGRAPWAGGRSRRYGVLEPARRLESRSGERQGTGAFVLRHLLAPLPCTPPVLLGEATRALALDVGAGLLLEPGWSGLVKARRLENRTERLAWLEAGRVHVASPRGGLVAELPEQGDWVVEMAQDSLGIRRMDA